MLLVETLWRVSVFIQGRCILILHGRWYVNYSMLQALACCTVTEITLTLLYGWYIFSSVDLGSHLALNEMKAATVQYGELERIDK